MPIHLPSISRREFLRRSLMAGAGLALSPSLLAAARRVDANSWALLADIHIAADGAGRRGNVSDAEADSAHDDERCGNSTIPGTWRSPLNTKEMMPCTVAVRRMVLSVMPTSETCAVMPITKEK